MAKRKRPSKDSTSQPNLPLNYNMKAEPGRYTLQMGDAISKTEMTSPKLGQNHVLQANDLITGSPDLGSPSVAVGNASGVANASGEGRTIAAATGIASGTSTAGAFSVPDAPPSQGDHTAYLATENDEALALEGVALPDDIIRPELSRGGELDTFNVEATAQVRDLPTMSTKAQISMASSYWTGRRSRREQVAVIEQFGPLAATAAKQLAAAMAEKRFNDPATHEALCALKDLHYALGELISAAERGKPLDGLWVAVENRKEQFFDAVSSGAKVMLAAPVLAIGMGQILSWLSGEPVTGQMLATLCGSNVVGTALLGRGKQPGDKRPDNPDPIG